MAIPTLIHLTALPDVSVSWSGRNGGQIFLLGGGVRGVMSRDVAQTIVDKLSRALSIPEREAEMADRDPAPELERIAAPDTMVGEDLRQRKGWLVATYPAKGRRLLALYGALACAGAEAEVVMIDGIGFTRDEASTLVASLESDIERVTGHRPS